MKRGENRLAGAFSSGERPVLITFTVAGDPDYETSLAIMHQMADAGAGIIELGLPFSDPVADGPVIQRADIRAMEAGMNTDRLFELVRDFRAESTVPIVVLTYANLVMRRGISRFYQQAAGAGIDGVVIADLPLEESDPFCRAAEETGISHIMMVSPTTSPGRLDAIVSRADGFIYLVAAKGVTGARSGVDPAARSFLSRIREKTRIPVAPGFGISDAGQVREWNQAGADGIIVGSAIVRRIEENLTDPDHLLRSVHDLIITLKLR